MTNAEFHRLLASVSRSFSLSLRLLPAEVRSAISLAYALARASDTIADSTDVPPGDRIQALRELPSVTFPVAFPVADRAERSLLDKLPDLLHRLDQSPDRPLIENVWSTVREGQVFDLSRFPSPHPLSPAELERYTYLVAGCVGEFWTDLCLLRLHQPFAKPAEEMRGLGRSFGCALQRVNILRDRASDATLGRIYISPDGIASEISHARSGLNAGAAYAGATRSRRLRAAVALPADLGHQTLDLIEQAPLAQRVRVSRSQVWRSLVRCLLFAPHDRSIG